MIECCKGIEHLSCAMGLWLIQVYGATPFTVQISVHEEDFLKQVTITRSLSTLCIGLIVHKVPSSKIRTLHTSLHMQRLFELEASDKLKL